MNKKFYHWEIALMVGLLMGILSLSADAQELPISCWQIPQETCCARYQVSVFPFGVGYGTGEVLADQIPEQGAEIEIRYYFPELWNRIRDAIGL